MKTIQVLLVDDHAIVRQGLRVLLESEPDLSVVGEAETGREALAIVQARQPEVVIMDLSMPGLNGMEATRQIIQVAPTVKVLVLSMYSDDEYVRQSIAWGVTGYLLKQSVAAELIKAIREVAAGNAFFSPAISRRVVEHYREAFAGGRPAQQQTCTLTSRETEVLQLIAEGFPNKAIANDLSISIKTVEKHRQQLMNKLKIHDVAGLTRYAMTKGIVHNNLGPLL
jgi:DNA-binding NarL/FixJ family response regulator